MMSPEESIGEILTKAREEQGKSLVEVEQATKIRAKYLKALENNQFDLIPGSVFVKGFLKSYAYYLKLDPKPLLEEYKNKYESKLSPKEKPISQSFPLKKPSSIISSRTFLLTIAFLGIILFLSIIFWPKSPSSSNKKVEKSKVFSSKPEKKPTQKVPPTKKESPQAPQTQGISVRVKVAAVEGCWLRVISDGAKVYEGKVKKGEVREWRAKNTLFLRAGNAGGIEIEQNGKLLPPLGGKGEVVEKTFTPGP